MYICFRSPVQSLLSLSLMILFIFQMFFSGQGVNQVDVPSTTGSFGILPSHVPIIAAMRPGILTVYDGGKQSKYFVSSGTISVNADSTCQILAEEAAPLEDLDLQAARQGLEQAQSQLSSSASEEDRAKATIGVEFHEALIKALE